MDEKTARDYMLNRPWTLGGSLRQNEEINWKIANQQYGPPATQLADGKAAATPRALRAPRTPYKFKTLDLVAAVVVFLATSLVLWRAMGGGAALAAGVFAGIIGARFWRLALGLLVIGGLLAIFLRHH